VAGQGGGGGEVPRGDVGGDAVGQLHVLVLRGSAHAATVTSPCAVSILGTRTTASGRRGTRLRYGRWTRRPRGRDGPGGWPTGWSRRCLTLRSPPPPRTPPRRSAGATGTRATRTVSASSTSSSRGPARASRTSPAVRAVRRTAWSRSRTGERAGEDARVRVGRVRD